MEKKLDFTEYDFIDFGCSSGGSMKFAQTVLGGKKGVGVDIDPKKVEETKKNGYNAFLADATTLHVYKNAVSFVIMSHFLEHLPGIDLAFNCIKSATIVAKDYIYIQQPYFDADGLLLQKKLKLYWSHWSGHKNHMSAIEFHNCLYPLVQRGALKRFVILGDERIRTSSSPCIHPLDSPRNSHDWDEVLHSPKRFEAFDFPCFKQIIVCIQINPSFNFDKVLNRIHFSEVLFDTANI